MKKALSILLLIAVFASALAPAASADGMVRLKSAADFRKFCQNCRSDAYSRGRTFLLTADIDLTGEAVAVSSFSGVFDGGGHTISGVLITADGSRQGLFRTVTEEGSVHDLTVKGAVEAGGTGVYVGGIAGESYGALTRCYFEGSVSGVEAVGGVAGYNGAPGTIVSCRFLGNVRGETMVGGVVGENHGLVRVCRSAGDVNTVAIETTVRQSFDISSLLEPAEDVILAVSDIGGVAGFSAGTVSRCMNVGRVGYPSVGYNVGGVVGRSSGYVEKCSSSGDVYGRRDVGGVVGQLEPYAVWDLSQSKLEELQERISLLDGAVNDMVRGAGAQTAAVSGALTGMVGQVNGALAVLGDMAAQAYDSEYVRDLRQRVEDLARQIEDDASAPEEPEAAEEPEIPDVEVTLPDQKSAEELLERLRAELEQAEGAMPDTTALIDALNGVYASAVYLGSAVGDSSAVLAGGAENISARVSDVLSSLVSTAQAVADVHQDRERDVSVERAYEQDMGAVSGCESTGRVQAEASVGGVLGTVGFEVSFDLEDELNLSDLLFSQAERQIFAVVRNCESHGDVSGRKDCAGGIVGDMSYGAALHCLAAGTVSSEGGDYVGGIAGLSKGSLISDYTQVVVRGGKYVGGIAGLAADMSGCRACAYVAAGEEYTGCIAGWADGELTDNVHIDTGAGGVDGVNYAGMAEAVSLPAMLRMEDTPEEFTACTLVFEVEGKPVETIEVPFGGALDALPEVPRRGGAYWQWEDFDASHIYIDQTITGQYRSAIQTLATGEEPPVFLAEGVFHDGQTLTAAPADTGAYPAPDENAQMLEAWTLAVNDYEGALTVRMRHTPDVRLYRAQGGALAPVEYARDGSYLVFSLENGDTIYVCELESRAAYLPWLVVGGAAALALLAVGLFLRKRKKTRAEEKQTLSP